MSNENLLSCPSCGRQCAPRLWHYRPVFGNFRYMKTQHLCPFCGVVMYESGGRMSPTGIIAVFLIVIPFCLIGLSDYTASKLGTDPGGTQTFYLIAYIALLMFIVGRVLYRTSKPLVLKIYYKLKSLKQT